MSLACFLDFLRAKRSLSKYSNIFLTLEYGGSIDSFPILSTITLMSSPEALHFFLNLSEFINLSASNVIFSTSE
ncbi:hypothetical protein ES703_88230 [subsurface metagenome]